MHRYLLCCLFVLASLANSLSAQNRLLNLPLTPEAPPGTVGAFALTQDGSRLAYLAAEVGDVRSELRVVDLVTGEIQRRSDGISAAERLVNLIVRDSRHAIVATLEDVRWDTLNEFYRPTRLYSVDLEGREAPRLLVVRSEPQGSSLEYHVSPDGRHVVYRVTRPGETSLIAVRTDGSGEPAELLSTPFLVDQVQALDDRILFRTRDETHRQILAASFYGSPGVIDLSPIEGTGAEMLRYRVSPTGQLVVFRADHRVAGTLELWATPLVGAPVPRRLNADLVQGGDVYSFRFDAVGSRVAYTADQLQNNRIDLFVASLTGDSPPIRINDSPSPITDVRGPVFFSPSGDRLAFMQEGAERGLILAEASGFGEPETVDTAADEFLFVGDQLVYTIGSPGEDAYTVVGRPVQGGQAPVSLIDIEGAPPQLREFEALGDRLAVTLWDGASTDSDRTFLVLPDGTGDPLPFLPEPDPDSRFAFLDGLPSRLFYHGLGSGEGRSLYEWTLTSGATAQRRNGPLSQPVRLSGIDQFIEDTETNRMVYIVSENASRKLFSVGLDAGMDHVVLDSTASLESSLNLFRVEDEFAVYAVGNQDKVLRSVPADGTGAPVQISPPETELADDGFLPIRGDGLAFFFGRGDEQPRHLYSSTIDGSSPATDLTPQFDQGDFRVLGFLGSSLDGSEFLAYLDLEHSQGRAAYAFPTQPGGSPREVELPSDFFEFPRATAEEDFLFLGTVEPSSVPELWAITGFDFSTLRRLSAPLAPGERVASFRLTADAEGFVYGVASEGALGMHLWVGERDGASAPRLLDTGGSVTSFQLTGSDRVVYRALRPGEDKHGLFELPLLPGGANRSLVSGAGLATVDGFQVDPLSGTTLVIAEDLPGATVLALVPPTPPRTPKVVFRFPDYGGYPYFLVHEFTGRTGELVFQAGPLDSLDLYLADAKPSTPTRRISVPLPGFPNTVAEVTVSGDGESVFYTTFVLGLGTDLYQFRLPARPGLRKPGAGAPGPSGGR